MPDSDVTPEASQGELGLLNGAVAQRLLAAPVPAHLAYTGPDTTPRVIPMNFLWTGDELVMGAFANTHKVVALRARPRVAVCIDISRPPEVLLLRGAVTLTEVDGVLPEYATAQRKTMGDEESAAYLTAIAKPGLRMVRIGLRPAWVGVLDHRTRFAERTPQLVLDALRQHS
jgi:hypothetical protein